MPLIVQPVLFSAIVPATATFMVIVGLIYYAQRQKQ